jgi:hypothetical protein
LAEDALLPDVIKWGASAAEVETALEGKCANGFINRPIDPPFLPNNPVKQVQIDCDGLEFLGAPRWTEFVIGDDRLQMVWIMVEADDKLAAIEALKDAYGAPSHETPMFVAFTQNRAAWREEPPEFLFYSKELAEPMSAWFDNPQ